MQPDALNSNQFTQAEPPRDGWLQLTDRQRIQKINTGLTTNPNYSGLVVQEIRNKTDVYVKARAPLNVNERGQLLLDLEHFLNETIDPGIRIWFEVTADKSALRKLRGVNPVFKGGEIDE